MSGSMSANQTPVASTKGDSGLSQARFGPGMLLQHEDLERLGAYPLEVSRLLFRAFFGCGVVCGLKVEPPTRDCGKVQVTVGAGVALGCSGDPISVPKPQIVVFDEQCGPQPLGDTLYVVLCRTTKRCAPRPASCGCDDDEASSVLTQERYGFEIRVVRDWPPCACGCRAQTVVKPPADPAGGAAPGNPPEERCACADPTNPCYRGYYEGNCGCNCGEASDCGCDCDCVVLARLGRVENDLEHPWHTDHSVRCFIRPLRMRDKTVEDEVHSQAHAAQQSALERKREADRAAKAKRDRDRKAKAEAARAKREREARERIEPERTRVPTTPTPPRPVRSTPPPK